MADKLIYRFCEFDRSRVNSDKRTIDLAFSSEYPVMRWDPDEGEYWEVLDHDERNVDLSRLRSGAPLLYMHRMSEQIGVVDDVSIDGDKKGRATVRFSKSSRADEIFQDVRDGIRKHVSVGYQITKVVGRDVKDGIPVLRFAWSPYEISSVPVPADPDVGVGRVDALAKENGDYAHENTNMNEPITATRAAQQGNQANDEAARKERKRVRKITQSAESAATANPTNSATIREMANEAIEDGDKFRDFMNAIQPLSGTPTSPGAGVQVGRGVAVMEGDNEGRDKERKRVRRITESSEQLAKDFPAGADKFRQMAREAIEKGDRAKDFQASLLPAIPGARVQNPITMAGLGMNEREQQSYSIVRAVQRVLQNEGRLDGLEGEAHQEMCRRNIGIQPQGFWIPPDAMMNCATRGIRLPQQRDLNVTTFGQGGAFVPTTLMVPIIEILRNRMVCSRLGVQPLSGLQGNVAIPRQVGAATAYALPESATLTKSTQAIDQILLTPHRVGAWNDYSKQLLLQSSVDVENFIRNDLMSVLAIKWDYLILQGAGANSEPTGIMNTTGIGSILFGAAADWAHILLFETTLSLANADAGNMAYVTTPKVRGKLKAAAKIGTTFPFFIWETYMWGDGSNDGVVNGYRGAVTNQILNDAVAFGNWNDAVGPALWGGYDVVVNPYTRDTDAVVRITINTFGDVAVRHPQSFAWSADSGAQ